MSFEAIEVADTVLMLKNGVDDHWGTSL